MTGVLLRDGERSSFDCFHSALGEWRPALCKAIACSSLSSSPTAADDAASSVNDRALFEPTRIGIRDGFDADDGTAGAALAALSWRSSISAATAAADAMLGRPPIDARGDTVVVSGDVARSLAAPDDEAS